MIQWKIGDKCWTWSLTVFGSYIPYFSQYVITNIIEQPKITFACLSHEHQIDMAMSIDLIFETKEEAINCLIKKLKQEKIKND